MDKLKPCPFCGSTRPANVAGEYASCSDCSARADLDDWATRADLSPQWLPIDSAPKDGTWVLIWIGWIGDPRSSAFEHGSWQNLPWVANSKDYNPTHWMPLPKPPTE